ncbi:hypothetical protein GN958_ATG23415 [Phytophthora infestans]|uniref:AB hydrolase-1 domain-containing protein n=1 Tax=Phytophthora infestans TaxID=4787 RepID=A0A8S9TGC9_PHYIN|nr:hypothetical protein GN958_ATG23415 [Phytophthora infestans]
MNSATTTSPILLFVHGTNFCKEIWRPIEHHLKELPLLNVLPDVHFVSIDLAYHGSNRDESIPVVVEKEVGIAKHPANNLVTLNTGIIIREVQRLRSMLALWNAEVQNPGTFGGLVLFEPYVHKPGPRDPKLERYIFNIAIKRKHRWETREAAETYFKNVKAFKTWHRERLACLLEGALVPEKEGSEAVVLACHPTIEAAAYSGERLWLGDEELSSLSCPVTFHSSDDTWLFDYDHFARLEQKWPHIYTNHPPMKNTTHNLIMEKPKACAKAIHADLKNLECFSLNLSYCKTRHALRRDESVLMDEVLRAILEFALLVTAIRNKMVMPTKSPLLLFVHGTNFCKRVWKPIENQLKKSPLLQHVEFASVELPFHGAKRDNSVRALVDEASLTVEHPAGNWVVRNTAEIHHEILQYQQQEVDSGFGRRPLIGVGHSIGAATL